jgi:hypothetical protein
MQTRIHASALAGLAALGTLGAAALLADTAEAHGKHRHRHGFGVIIGSGYDYGYGYGYGFRPYRRDIGGCGWLFARWQDTGHPKWYNRWHMCRYGY